MSSTASVSDQGDQSAQFYESGWHPANIVHLVMALIFLGVLVVWAVVQGGALGTADLRWLLPLPLLLAGAAGLIAIALSGRRRSTPSSPDPTSRPDQNLMDEDVSIDELVNDDTQEIR